MPVKPRQSVFTFQKQRKSIFQLSWFFCTVLVVQVLIPTSLTSAGDDVASNAVVHKAGLSIAWSTQIGDGGYNHLVDWQMVVNENNATTYFVLEAGTYRHLISQNDLNAFGQPFGLDGAVEYMEVQKEIVEARLKAEGKTDMEIKTSQYSLPQTTFYGLTSNGHVKAIDGDTGALRWTTSIGDYELASTNLGANEEYVAAINGSSLYLLEASTGKLLWSQLLLEAVGASPAITAERVYVPLTNGRMEALTIAENGIESFSYIGRGSGTGRPHTTDVSIAWPTDAGDLNVAPLYGGRKKGISYRLVADDAIVSPATFKSGMRFVSSLDGFVYAVQELEGRVIWEISLGGPISQSPIPHGSSVYAITDEGFMYRLNGETGKVLWSNPVPNVGSFVAGSKSHLYVTDTTGRLVSLDPLTGSIASVISVGNVEQIVTNYQTDRIYIASNTGALQCLRETASKIPFFHSDEFVEPDAIPDATQPVKVDRPTEDSGAGASDPFATPAAAADPFATPTPKANTDAESDPFATPAATQPTTPAPAATETDPFAPKPAAAPEAMEPAKEPAKDAADNPPAGEDKVVDDPFGL